MSYKEFLTQIEKQVQSRMGKEARICIHSVTKNNSVILDGLSILEYGDNVSPAIYLNSFYQEYLSGETMEQIVNRILFYYHQGKKVHRVDTSFYTDIRKARKRMVCRVINREKNQKLLEEVPYRPFLNLAVVYYYLLEQKEIGSAAILIRKEHLNMWGMEEKEIHAIAMENTRKLLPCEFLSMEEMIYSMLGENDFSICNEEAPLYVLTNNEKSYGAVWMTDGAVLEMIAEQLDGDYYVLPSSIHECMVVPVRAGIERRILAEMVEEMNMTQVEPEEVLADNIYCYVQEEKCLKMIQL